MQKKLKLFRNKIDKKNELNTLDETNSKSKFNMIIKIILLAIISVVIAVVFELFVYENLLRVWTESIKYIYSILKDTTYIVEFSFIRVCFFVFMIFFIGLHFIIKPKKIYEFICDKRYYIAIIFLSIAMILGLHGSSISRANRYFIGDKEPFYEIFGVPREIRTDEWGTQSLYIFSQEHNNYERTSSILRGTETDMFTLVNAPVKDILMIGRPFQVLFLILGNTSAAFSFYWYARIVLMCLITYEIMMILTNKKKLLSLAGMILISFSAAVQWWYCMDTIIWGEVILVLLNVFLKTKKKSIKVLCGIGEVIALLSYVFVFYPAWQISVVYILIPIFVLIIINNIKEGNLKTFNIFDVTIILLTILVVISLLVYWYTSSEEAIKITSETVYPGQRVETGGGEISLLGYFYNIFMPYENFTQSNKYFENGLETYINQCENSSMLSLYPIPIILSLVYLIRNKKKDIYLILSLIVSIFLSVYCIVGVPEFLAKFTLLSMSTGARVAVPLAAICIYMFIYLISKLEDENCKIIENGFIHIVVALIMMCICLFLDGNNYLKIWQIIFSAVVFAAMFYLSLGITNKIKRKILLVMMCIITLIGGLFVNPISQGIDCILDTEFSKVIQKYVEEDPDGIWIGADIPFFVVSNYLASNGARTLTSTNVYPNSELYQRIVGTDEKYEEIWNRYHHIYFSIYEAGNSLKLVGPDVVKIMMNYIDLNDVGIDYILTIRNLESQKMYSIDNVELIEEVGVYKIYKVLEQN